MTSGLSAVQVHLVDLPALYSHGLRHALVEAGITRVVVIALGELLNVMPPEGPFVVVVPHSRLAHLTQVLRPGGDDIRCGVVELVDSVSLPGLVSSVSRGAVGVVESGAESEVVVDAVRSAVRGQFLLPGAARRLLAGSGAQLDPPALGTEEIEWLRRLGQGATVATLASAAAYSEREMYRLLSRVYQRLGAATRTQALLNAQRWGLLDEPGS